MEKTIKKILVPLNFSNSSANALKIAIAMCKRHDASLHLLKVNEKPDLPYPFGKNALLIGLRLETWVAEIKSMETQANQIEKNHDIKCFYHIGEGPFAKTVAETADNFYCDLIVVEKKKNSTQIGLYSNRDICAVIRASSCPVMSIPGNCSHVHFKSVLFPVWVKQSVLNKLRAVLPIIEKNTSKVVLLGSVNSSSDASELNRVDKLICSVRALFSLVTKNIENEVGDTPTTARSILNKAVEYNSELIVISAKVHQGFQSLFKQNYVRFIINNSTVPVLSVK